MERLQTGQDRSSTSKVSRLNTVPTGQRYAMVMPSYFSSLSRFNATKPSPYHHDMQGKTILAFRRIVLYKGCAAAGNIGHELGCIFQVPVGAFDFGVPHIGGQSEHMTTDLIAGVGTALQASHRKGMTQVHEPRSRLAGLPGEARRLDNVMEGVGEDAVREWAPTA